MPSSQSRPPFLPRFNRTAFLYVWMFFTNAVILLISLYQGDSVIGIGSALTGVTCVVLCGMGKTSYYTFGLANIILYAIVAWKARYYGDVMLNLLYYLPTNIFGWFEWRKQMNADTNSVIIRRLTYKNKLFLVLICGISVYIYGIVLRALGGNLPIVDSASTVLSIIGQFLLIKRYIEHWFIWLIVDSFDVVMWIAALKTDGASVATLLMWIVFTINAVVMYLQWRFDIKRQSQTERKDV